MTMRGIERFIPGKDLVPVKEDNPDPRVPVVLLLDMSPSMGGSGAIQALSDGYAKFIEDVNDDPLASVRADVAVVGFWDDAQVVVPFQEGRALTPKQFETSGSGTNIGRAVLYALDLIRARQTEYADHYLESYQPWLFLLTDGGDNGGQLDEAVRRVRALDERRRLSFFAVGTGTGVDWDVLRLLSGPGRPPLRADSVNFREMFVWLSKSLKMVSHTPSGGVQTPEPQDGVIDAEIVDDDLDAAPTQQTPLPAVQWGTVPTA